jgi:REP element-mobilizing transposase RayT
MRKPREKVSGRSCYYHCCARIAGEKNHYLFTDVDKEKGMNIVQVLSQLFYIEVISMCWMGNHWHIVLYAPHEVPDLKDVEIRYNSFYGPNHRHLSVDNDPEGCQKMAEQLIDISFFMRQIHQKFTYYINRVHNRRGTLWSERFKSTILEDKDALWSCVKYIELNPVRANMVKDPANYRFSTWGRYCGSGKHMFYDNFIKHMRSYLGEIAKDWDGERIMSEFRGEIARTIAYESGLRNKELHQAIEKGKKKESMPLRYLRRTRHWSNGGIIGSKSFVQEMGCLFNDKKRVMKKKLSRGSTIGAGVLYSFKRLHDELSL